MQHATGHRDDTEPNTESTTRPKALPVQPGTGIARPEPAAAGAGIARPGGRRGSAPTSDARSAEPRPPAETSPGNATSRPAAAMTQRERHRIFRRTVHLFEHYAGHALAGLLACPESPPDVDTEGTVAMRAAAFAARMVEEHQRYCAHLEHQIMKDDDADITRPSTRR